MTQKEYLRAEYRRIRRNYNQMIRRDFEKYLVPKDIARYVPPIPRIISDDKLFRNAAIDRIAGAIRRLNRNINAYKIYRNSFERLDDAVLRKYYAFIIDVMTNEDPPAKYRANRIFERLETGIGKSKRERHFVSQRISKRWQYLMNDTRHYLYASRQPEVDNINELFAIVIRDIFQPQNDEDKYFKEVWDTIEDELFNIADDGIDDIFGGYYEY